MVIERLIAGVDAAKLDTPTSEGRFTPREVVAHLADWEPILLGRIRQTVEQPGSTLEGYDEGQRAIDGKYSETDVVEQAKQFKGHRAKTVAYLQSLPASDWDKSAVHSERGPMTVRDWAAAIVGHDMYHVEQLTSVM